MFIFLRLLEQLLNLSSKETMCFDFLGWILQTGMFPIPWKIELHYADLIEKGKTIIIKPL